MPPWLIQRYFTALPDEQYRINNRVRSLVRFSRLNLADTLYPPPLAGPETLSAVFCRNVLIYFDLAQVSLLLQRFHRSLADGGWLMVSPSEIALVNNGPLQRVWLRDITLFRKTSHVTPESLAFPKSPPVPAPPAVPRVLGSRPPIQPPPQPVTSARREPPPPPSRDLEAEKTVAIATARQQANQGRYQEALALLDKMLAGHRLDADVHYLRATIAWEAGETEEAQNSLRRALFLEPNFILAHYLMASLARMTGNSAEAERHRAITLDLLENFDPEAEVPHSEGLSAAQLRNLVGGLENNPNG